MDFQSCCGSSLDSLPLIWAIEALACSDCVDTSLLLDLLKKMPQRFTGTGKNAMELVSLKILENLFIQGARANPISSAPCNKVRLDPSDHCHDVLRRITSQSHLNSAGAAGPEISKWNLEPFIAHKKSTLRICALKQLKDAIVTGGLSISASLKEKSGLPVGSRTEYEAPTKDGNCNAPRVEGGNKDDGNLMPSDFPDGNLVPVNRKRRARESPAEQLCTTSINSAKKNKHDIISNEQYVGGQLISSRVHKKTTDASLVSVLVDPYKVLPCGKKNNPSGEKQRQDQNIEKGGAQHEACDLRITNDNVDGFDRYMNSADEVKEKVHAYNDNDGTDDGKSDIARKENACAYIQDSLETTNSRDRHHLADASKRYREVSCSFVNETFMEAVRQTGFPGDGNNDQGNSSKGLAEDGVDISRDDDGYHDERMTIDAKKKAFLSSQCTYSQDSLATTNEIELHLCMKCHKGGSLLSCTSDSCPIVIHESCLGSDKSSDARETFFCPFCAYARAISKYMDVKQYVSLARKELSTFICRRNI